MSSFNLLSKKMQQRIWDMQWTSFTDIQNKAIPEILNTNNDIIISSSTASGKTEAAFLPILTAIEDSTDESLKVIYVSPLKALINNQFSRIENLISTSNIEVHKWHGDVSSSKKSKLLKKPSGILQITPESIESLFINKTNYLRSLFKDVDFIVIDEIHAFLNSERGTQLRSLISRIETYSLNRPRIIGLSATISNYDFIKQWIREDNTENVQIIEENNSGKPLNYALMHFNIDGIQKPIEFYEDIRELTKNMKTIIFCNSRAEVEVMTVSLNRLALKEGHEEMYYPHHSSIDKEIREYVEKKMLESDTPKTIIATSSLELGIDIGNLELVIQVDTTNTVSSLKQRLGRSGRKLHEEQYLQLYTTCDESLIQSIAVMELQLEKWVELAQGYKAPYDILFHQIISICCEKNGVGREELLLLLEANNIFRNLNHENVKLLIDYMIKNDYLECLEGSNEIIVGLAGERILRNKEFYGVFMTPVEYDVVNVNKKIGKLERGFYTTEGVNIILAGKLWMVDEINDNKKKIYVSKAINANPPKFSSGMINFDKKIGYKMMEILCSDKDFDYIDITAKTNLDNLRVKYRQMNITTNERVIWKGEKNYIFGIFTGTKVYKTILWMLRFVGVNVTEVDGIGNITFKNENLDNVIEKIEEIKSRKWKVDELLSVTNDNEFFESKYSKYLPKELQILMHIEQEIDLQGALEYFNEFEFIVV